MMHARMLAERAAIGRDDFAAPLADLDALLMEIGVHK
jgi:hypothetical protein